MKTEFQMTQRLREIATDLCAHRARMIRLSPDEVEALERETRELTAKLDGVAA